MAIWSSAKRTPSLSYIVPDRCHDGSPGPCPGGGAGGLAAADAMLEQIVPKILASQAYKHGRPARDHDRRGALERRIRRLELVLRAAALPQPAGASGLAAALPPEGGGQVGALLLSPFVKGGDDQARNRSTTSRCCARSRTSSALKHLGYAAAAHVELARTVAVLGKGRSGRK